MSITDGASIQHPWDERWFWIFLPTVLSIIPFAEPIRDGSLAGAGPDVVSSVWAMWWYQQSSWSSIVGGESTLFNYPWGGSGMILSPLCAQVWSMLDRIVGSAWATTLTDLLLLNSMMWTTVWLGRILSCTRLICGVMAMCWLLPRYIIFTLGETGVVGVAALPMIFGLGAWWRYKEIPSVKWASVLVLCTGLQALENPYLAPGLPLLVLMDVVVSKRWHDLKVLAMGVLTMIAVVVLFRSGSGDYESIKPTGYTQLFGLYFPAVEREWARTEVWQMVFPQSVLWPSGSMDSIHIQGRGFVGYTSLLMVSVGLWYRRTRWWSVLAIMGLLMTMGSDWNGVPSIFGLLNSLANVVVRPFTQPSRYFVVFVCALSVVTGLVLQQHRRWQYPMMVAMILESMIWGGLALRVPSTEMPQSDCAKVDELQGPVLVWPWDGTDDQWYESSINSRLFQMLHNQPAATISTGSWFLEGNVFPGKRLRDLGWRKAVDMKGRLNVPQLQSLGYQYVLIDKKAGRVLTRHGRDAVFGSMNLIEECDNIIILEFE